VRISLATRFSVALVSVVLVALAGIALAMFVSWRAAGLFTATIQEALARDRAARELEIALLADRGYVSYFMLDDGNRAWLDRLDDPVRSFAWWMDEARRTAHHDADLVILAKLEAVHRDYAARRREVVALYDAGQPERATEVLTHEVYVLYREAFGLCEEFIEASNAHVEQMTAQAHRDLRRASWWVAACALATSVLGAGLLARLFRDVLLPLRRMAADARRVSDPAPQSGERPATDELVAIGAYLQALMSDVALARSDLEASRTRLAGAEKLASVGKLAASVAHEMRNPLTAAKMWLFAIQASAAGDPELLRKLAIVSDEIARLESVIRNFLQFARPPALRRADHDVSRLLDKTLELCRHHLDGKQIRLVRREAAGLPPVHADPDQFKQVLVNLLHNAADATPPSGEVRLEAGRQSDAEGRDMVVVRVGNAGPDMPEEVRRRIFEPFFSTKEEGTGLGLCIAASIMARHEGRLALESSAEGWTTFAVWIPAAQGAAT
jgi:signal transduction histidine kinase